MNPHGAGESVLGTSIASYLELHRSLGRKYRNEGRTLADLDRFLAARSAEALTATEFDAWALSLGNVAPTVRRQRMLIVRKLCLYLRRTDPDCFVPDPHGFPIRSSSRRPFIFSRQQVLSLLQEADRLHPAPVSPLRPVVYRLAIALLYTTGLRCGELVRLTIEEYHSQERTLLVRASKFHKSRLVALSDSAAAEVERYLEKRRQLPHGPGAPLLANGHGGRQAYNRGGLSQGLRNLYRVAGIRTESGATPRTHDMRHTYAVHVLHGWYRAGVDPQSRLPKLAAAMGHISVASTAVYLTSLSAVAEAASERFARHVAPVLGTAQGGRNE